MSTKNLVLVGNAALSVENTKLIDTSDFVVRFNERNSMVDSDGKTDLLFATNIGRPAQRFCERHSFLGLSCDIWFVRDESVHRKYFEKVRSQYPEYSDADLEDFSEAIIDANQLKREKVFQIPHEINEITFSKLVGIAKQPFYCPSTGILGIEHILSSPAFSSYRKHVVGFTFEGWDGHPWAAERALISEHEEAGSLVFHTGGRCQKRKKSVISRLSSKLF